MSVCQCGDCAKACREQSGYLMPDDLLNYREDDLEYHDYMGMTVPAPKMIGEGEQKRCTFLDESNMCKVHTFKPWECREYTHFDSIFVLANRHAYVMTMWADYYASIDDDDIPHY